MRRFTLSLCFVLSCLLLFACAPKRQKPIEPPVEPSGPAPPADIPVPSPTPSTPPKRELEPPPLKPRAPSPGDTAALKLVDRGVKHLNAGQYEDAEQLFEQALRVSPTNGKPLYYLGVISVKQKNYDRAIGFLTQAEVYLHRDSFWMSQVLLHEGLAFKGLNQRQQAKSKFEESLRLDPTNKWAESELRAFQ